MTNFELDDQKGRDIFKSFCAAQPWCTINREAKKKYSSWDVSYYSGDTKIIGEIKVRYYNHDSFDTWIMETKKLEALQSIKTKDTLINYINIFNDDKILIWDISNINQPSSIEEHQQNDYTQNTVNKSITYLSTSQSTIYNFKK